MNSVDCGRATQDVQADDAGAGMVGCDESVSRVGSFVERDLISLPSWFPAPQAAAILRHKGKTFVVVTDKTGIDAVASVQSLSHAPATKSVRWCAVSLGQSVTPDLPVEEAVQLMDLYGVDCLPVVAGGTIGGARGGPIVGMVTRERLEAATLRSGLSPESLAA